MTRLSLLVLPAVVLLTAGCAGTTPAPDPDPVADSPRTSSALSPAERSSVLAEAGIPPEPDPATAAAYIEALEAIDPDIVHGDPEKAIDRGRNQCSSVANVDDEQRLIASTDMRFISSDHPAGFGSAVAEQILRVVRTHLCPGD